MGLILGVVLLEGRLPHRRHRIVQQGDERGIGELDLLPCPGRDGPEFQVGVGQLAEDLACRAGECALHRQQLLLRLGENMRPGPHQPFEQQPVGGERRQFHPGEERGGRDREDLRPDEARRLAGPCGHVLEPAHHSLGIGGPLVFSGAEERVGSDPVAVAIDVEIEGKAVSQPLDPRSERAGKAGEAGDPLFPGH